ncbi:hypothetical protein P2G88_01630 [Aliiglaciecola sp. CAU 1673]|uniref:hypothetical protein n=1 Tax=Aliiglaciecola sp. CAU 1673 TaxID=3032595 RepID=UPI0023DC5710|nr:hypothetical protein [Aliiglaciecola sp. CAU 1673]MDF2176953.1 hypothetical protein [Aliiglaciecola sp. CAU 1673]
MPHWFVALASVLFSLFLLKVKSLPIRITLLFLVPPTLLSAIFFTQAPTEGINDAPMIEVGIIFASLFSITICLLTLLVAKLVSLLKSKFRG